jgi:hypothetical protein
MKIIMALMLAIAASFALSSATFAGANAHGFNIKTHRYR